MGVLIQKAPFSVESLYADLLGRCGGAAVVTFTGYVRDHNDCAGVVALELEHYPGMTERVLESLGAEATKRFGLLAWHIVHRYGRLTVAEPIVWVGVAADHRGSAFNGCEFIMDALKTDAPFWKREHFARGGAKWVSHKMDDQRRRKGWEHPCGDKKEGRA